MTFTVINSENGNPVAFVNAQFTGGGGATANFEGIIEIPVSAFPIQLTSIEIFPRQVNTPPNTGFLEVIPVIYEVGEAVIYPDDEPAKKNKNIIFWILLAAAILASNKN